MQMQIQMLDSSSLTVKVVSPSSPSPYNNNNSSIYSPSLVSPPSSAFVSALQSPYISPRATTTAIPPPVSYSSEEDDIHIHIPSTSSYAPPPIESTSYEECYFSAPPRTSFSFQSLAVPRISSSASIAKLRSCDVYIGFHGGNHNPNLIRFCKWLKSELELQGIVCFVADRSSYSDHHNNHEILDRLICSVTHGVVVVTTSSLYNNISLEEIRFFAQKKNLIPVFFDTDLNEIISLLNNPNSSSIHKQCKEAIDKCNPPPTEFKVKEGNWRSCISKIAHFLRSKLGRQSVAEKECIAARWFEGEELPFPRNKFFVGREKEMVEIENALFGRCLQEHQADSYNNPPIISNNSSRGETSGQSESGLADEDSSGFTSNTTSTTDTTTIIRERGRNGYIDLELRGKCKEPTLEAWVEPPPHAVLIGGGRKRSSKYNKKSSKNSFFGGTSTTLSNSSSVMCINGVAGIGKTELALEFAYRYSQRYKMVLWVGGEDRYLRQNILNLSVRLGLDVSADEVKERGRFRSFEEQEVEAFKRVKKELFNTDIPYLLIIDNLETDNELQDFISRRNTSNTGGGGGGGTHIIITTRLFKVMNSDMLQQQLPPLPFNDAMVLIRGRRKKEYSDNELEFLRKFDEKLGRLSFGLWMIGSMLSELEIFPSALFDAISQVPLPPLVINMRDDDVFLMKLVGFCLIFLQQQSNSLALRMFHVGIWFAPAPIASSLLASSANNIPPHSTASKGLKKWILSGCCCKSQAWKGEEEEEEEDAALLLVRIGLARRCNKQQPAGGYCCIQFHQIGHQLAKRIREGSFLAAGNATVEGVVIKSPPPKLLNSEQLHLWASAFMVFGYKTDPPIVQLKAIDMVIFIKKTALPLAVMAFTTFSRCISGLELLKVCTNVLEDVEKSFVSSQIHDSTCISSSSNNKGSFCCWNNKCNNSEKVDEYLWQDVTLFKATLLETRAKLLMRGGHFDNGEDLCRTCISIRTVMLGHNHSLTMAAQQTLANIVRLRTKF